MWTRGSLFKNISDVQIKHFVKSLGGYEDINSKQQRRQRANCIFPHRLKYTTEFFSEDNHLQRQKLDVSIWCCLPVDDAQITLNFLSVQLWTECEYVNHHEQKQHPPSVWIIQARRTSQTFTALKFTAVHTLTVLPTSETTNLAVDGPPSCLER